MNLRDRLRRAEAAASHVLNAAASGQPACPECGWPTAAVAHATLDAGEQLGLCETCGRWRAPDGRPFAEGARFTRPGAGRRLACRVPPALTAEDQAAIERITARRGPEPHLHRSYTR